MTSDLDAQAPPHSVEAEQSVLGGLLLDNSAWPWVQGLLTDGDFFRHEHRLMYAAIGALVAEGKPADLVTVFLRMQSQSQSDESTMAYLHSVAGCVPNAANVRSYCVEVRENAQRRALLVAADFIATAARKAPDAGKALDAARLALDGLANKAYREPVPLFEEIDMQTLCAPQPEPAVWWWGHYLPPGHVTLLGGHGGAGKSVLGLMLAACLAVGRDCLGQPTRRARVLYFSGEDPASLVVARLATICRRLDLDPEEVRQNLHVIDATEFDPVLFAEVRNAGIRSGVTTPTYKALAAYVDSLAVDVVIVDNASDAFDGDEIARSLVRAFMRALARLVRARGGAVLLLAHVDKATSRAPKGTGNTEGYSGSTAWHNSARSRLFLVEQEAGRLELQHQKSNLGQRQPPLSLEWPTDGLPRAVAVRAPFQWIEARTNTKAMLKLLHEFTGRGEFVATGPTSSNNAKRLLSGQATYPCKGNEVFDLLRDAERDRFIERHEYRTPDRKPHERWTLTPKGYALIDAAPTAPACANYPLEEVGAHGADASGAPAPAAPAATGGYGGTWSAQKRLAQADSKAPDEHLPAQR